MKVHRKIGSRNYRVWYWNIENGFVREHYSQTTCYLFKKNWEKLEDWEFVLMCLED